MATFIANCRVYHHTQVNPGPHSSGIGILEYAASDKRRGMIGIFGLAGCTDRELCVTPKGLHPGYTYQITFLHSMETARRTGLDIMREGLPIIGMHPLASRVVLFEAVGRVVPGD